MGVVKTIGKTNKELNIKIVDIEKEIVQTQTENENIKALAKEKISSVKENYKSLQNELDRMIEENESLKSELLEQKCITAKVDEINNIKTEEHERTLEEIELLKSNLKEKEIQILKKNESISALEKQVGGFAFNLDRANEFEQKFKSLERDIEPQKCEIKTQKAIVKACGDEIKKFMIQLNHNEAKIQVLEETIKKNKLEKQVMQKELKVKDAEQSATKLTLKTWKHEHNLQVTHLKDL